MKIFFAACGNYIEECPDRRIQSMATESVSPLLRHLRKLAARQTTRDRPDRELLQNFAALRDETAFAALVERYGPLVWGVCQRVLRDRHDAEDAFQATFLVLARQAGSVCKKEAAGSWLYGVAYRTALSQQRAAMRRRQREKQGPIREPEQPPTTASLRELQRMLDEEVARLPAKYRSPFVLCCLEGKSYADAARELGCKEGTVSSRLAKARKQLQNRLIRRGVTLSSVLCAAALSPTLEAAPAGLVANTIKGVLLSLSGTAALSAQAMILANGGTKMFSATIWKLSAIVLLAAAPLAVGAGLLMQSEQPLGANNTSEDNSPLAHAARLDDKPKISDMEMREEDAEMHVIGVYSAKNRGEKQNGSVEVEVRPTSKPVVLVLTSYLSVDWHVKLIGRTRIKKAIISGYDAQEIQGLPAGVPVENRSYYPADGSRRKRGWFWASNWNTPQWREMVRRLNEMTGLPVASFQGKYVGDSFIVDGKRGRDMGQNGSIPRAGAHKELTPRELLTACADAELHVVGMYSPDISNPGKPVDMEVRSTAKPVVLVLTSYMEVVWNVHLARGARVKAVLVAGYFPQVVEGIPADVPVQYFCPDASSFYFDGRVARQDKQTFYAYRWNTFEYRRMVERLNDLTGLLVSTFQGGNTGTSFVVDGARGSRFAQKERKPRPTLPKEPTPRELLVASTGAELHVVSIYSPSLLSINGDAVDVEVLQTDKPIVLALASYSTVLWNVRMAPGARVKAVIIAGYYEQEFEGIPADIPLVYRSYFPSQKGGYFFGHEWNTPENSPCKGQIVAKRLNELTGLPVSTFQGEYEGTSFVVDGRSGRDFAAKHPKAEANAQDDVADIPSEELRAGEDANKRYFLIGAKKDAKQPANGYSLFVIMPGGNGSADFHPFVKRIYKNSLSDRYLAAQPIAFKWTADQKIVWPTKTNKVAEMKFSTEDFVDSVIQDVAKKHIIDPSRVFTLSWSSSGPAAYAISLQNKNRVKGSFIAMSVFNPRFLPDLKAAKGHAYYLYHSPDDRVCPYRVAEQAKTRLSDNGAKVRLETYEGGHGWRGDLYEDIRQGVDWLEKQKEKTDQP
jgi:RNA polymerase sigma factor (sigma-70 family)